MTTAAATGTARQKRHIPGFAQAQRVGRSLMLPIAVLPAAGLLLRFGQPDMLGSEGVSSWNGMGWMQPVADVLAAAGNAVFGNLPIIFALGVAIGFARKSDGSTALAGIVGYLTFAAVLDALAPYFGAGAEGEETINYGVLGGITIGIIAAVLWQRYYRTKLPPYLAFFGGRRLVPIITAFVAVIVAVLFALVYPAFNYVIGGFGEWVTDEGNTVIGGFVFGTVNRLLIPFGLHHLLNNLPWFQFGEFTNPDTGQVAQGDIFRFFAGDPTAGTFMTGFFPIMMFALPAAALAIWRHAKPERRKVTGGIMVSVALTAFLTGITEPLEYAFAYVAFPLYVVHAVLTGTSLALVNWLDLHHGFTFSAGAIDYLLNFGIATGPIWIIPIGLGYAAIYYLIFSFAIKRWNLRTPGREEDGDVGSGAPSVFDEAQEAAAVSTGKRATDAEAPASRRPDPAGAIAEDVSKAAPEQRRDRPEPGDATDHHGRVETTDPSIYDDPARATGKAYEERRRDREKGDGTTPA
ncbi:PTS N-acetylglucosamine transporter subunit IIBC [Georgenia subflava]|uniref:PTS N-acetylglucosamine transporter subunit IIBC n=1 Tax=Georgenia subflava TaxID=1622177 RepID=A0A6N7EPH2_9MICO|nr:PTS transporter subunit EIIC [Georgenia subflava]MPV39018.1 PTS N-acetylglucosamine transporter subunit IIBC [Georgenia subflava]